MYDKSSKACDSRPKTIFLAADDYFKFLPTQLVVVIQFDTNYYRAIVFYISLFFFFI